MASIVNRVFAVPAGLVLGVIAAQQYKYVRRREESKIRNMQSNGEAIPVLSDTTVQALQTLPLRLISRAWGAVNELQLPIWMRQPLLGSYARVFGCNLDECVEPDLRAYTHLQDFFTRTLKPNARPVCASAALVCPSDGHVLHFGKVVGDQVPQVKNVTYSLKTFLGADHTESAAADEETRTQRPLYQIVIYLAPGDYHYYHSPTEWFVQKRRHFPGELFSVNPGLARILKGLFSYNERVVLTGQWQYGFMAYAAIGATNVGSMTIDFDPDVVTNRRDKFIGGQFEERRYTEGGVALGRGDRVGGFRLGSTIVMVFEGPPVCSACQRASDESDTSTVGDGSTVLSTNGDENSASVSAAVPVKSNSDDACQCQEVLEFVVRPGETVRVGQPMAVVVSR